MKSFERFLPLEPIVENTDFAIYGNSIVAPYAGKLLEIITIEKERILRFFRVEYLKKIEINLYDRHEDYLSFTKQFYNLAPYSRGNFIDKMISHTFEPHTLDKNIYTVKCSLVHELVHIVYMEIWQNLYERIVWLDEGLAQNLSREKSLLEKADLKFENWYRQNIVGPTNIIPDITFLKKHGSKFGEFVDGETQKYSGYKVSYLLVRYLLELGIDFDSLTHNIEAIEELETHIVRDCIAHYNAKFHIEEPPQFAGTSLPKKL